MQNKNVIQRVELEANSVFFPTPVFESPSLKKEHPTGYEKGLHNLDYSSVFNVDLVNNSSIPVLVSNFRVVAIHEYYKEGDQEKSYTNTFIETGSISSRPITIGPNGQEITLNIPMKRVAPATFGGVGISITLDFDVEPQGSFPVKIDSTSAGLAS